MTIPTLRQYADARQRETAAEYGATLAEVRDLYPEDHYAADWERVLIDAIEAGETLPMRHWRALSRRRRGLIYQTRRVQRDQALYARLVATDPDVDERQRIAKEAGGW